ncbi:MAG: hypothetical protein EPN93_08275 [Spirochaetes bacterium]|nr:MAG: hypothetical protein EPN93_08275 [Spirochaetota bacterium]
MYSQYLHKEIKTNKTFDLSSLIPGGEASLSVRIFHLAVGAVFLWGLLVCGFVMHYVPPVVLDYINFTGLVLICLTLALIGIMMSGLSYSALTSFIGYNLVAIPLGLLIAPALPAHGENVINVSAFCIVFISAAMLLGLALPSIIDEFNRSLIAYSVIMIIMSLVDYNFSHILTHKAEWVISLSICGYICVHWAYASRFEKSLDAAVDTGANLYMDLLKPAVKIAGLLSGKSK